LIGIIAAVVMCRFRLTAGAGRTRSKVLPLTTNEYPGAVPNAITAWQDTTRQIIKRGAGNQLDKNGFVYLTPLVQHEAHGSEAEKSSVPSTSSSERPRKLLPFGDDNITRLTEHRSLKNYEDFILP
jgi:hypothetical protein